MQNWRARLRCTAAALCDESAERGEFTGKLGDLALKRAHLPIVLVHNIVDRPRDGLALDREMTSQPALPCGPFGLLVVGCRAVAHAALAGVRFARVGIDHRIHVGFFNRGASYCLT